MNIEKGVVLIACGSWYYGEMAYNLAMSIRYNDPKMPITLYHSGNAMNHIHKYSNIFTEVKEMPSHCITKNSEEDFIKAKTYLYDLSPYKETIFIDADVMLLYNRSISDLFNELKDMNFTIGCREKKDLSNTKELIWVKPQDLIDAYDYDGVIYNLSSEFIYFKKCEEVYEYFNLVKQLYDEPNVEYTKFNGSVADELPFMLGMILNPDIKPHKVPFLPFYWEHYEKKLARIDQIKDDYWGYSLGGNTVKREQKRVYDGLATVYSNAFGTPVFAARDKRTLIKKREKI